MNKILRLFFVAFMALVGTDLPASAGAHTVFRYTQNNLSAAVAYKGDKYATFIMGVPFEAVTGVEKR